PNDKGVMAGMQGAYSSFFGPDPINLIGVVILTSLGTWGLPQMVTKFYTIKNEHSIKAGTVVSTVFALIVAGGCYFLGGFGRIFVAADETGAPVGGFDAIIPTMLEKLPDLLIGVVVVLVLSASMSTLSSLVLTSSSSITLDLIKPFMFKGKLDEKKQLIILRAFVAVFLVVSVLIALNKNALISDLMGYSWGALAGAFVAPFLYGILWKKTTKLSVYVSFIIGIGLTITHLILASMGMLSGTFLGFTVASPVNLGAFTMVISLIIVPIVSLITPKLKKEDVDRIFSCYEKKVTVNQSEAITSSDEASQA
ncbi:MAG: sodium:solute symporter, partial [Ruminiclostridium sp.]|nr:sodium:solute symporter [Ruminiclostridium sp.]